jgi:hypothetical protein
MAWEELTALTEEDSRLAERVQVREHPLAEQGERVTALEGAHDASVGREVRALDEPPRDAGEVVGLEREAA